MVTVEGGASEFLSTERETGVVSSVVLLAADADAADAAACLACGLTDSMAGADGGDSDDNDR